MGSILAEDKTEGPGLRRIIDLCSAAFDQNEWRGERLDINVGVLWLIASGRL